MINCLICNSEFTLKSSLTKHLNNNRCKNVNYKVIHKQIEKLNSDKNNIKCLLCDTKFTFKNNLIKHLTNNRCKNINYKLLHELIKKSNEKNFIVLRHLI